MKGISNNPELTPFERKRIGALLNAARNNDWAAFRSLSDGGFPNEESMHEQFAESKSLLDYASLKLCLNTSIGRNPDGSRTIILNLRNKASNTRHIVLTLHSKARDDGTAATLWTFHQLSEFDW